MLTTQNGDKKTCGRCSVEKSIDDFPKSKPGTKSYNTFKNGIKPWCKECYREYNKKYMAEKRKTDARYDHYQRKYGLSREQFEQMHEERKYCCDICGNESDHRYDKLCVDHCHTTGKVRGLLCFSCNVMLGQAKDDVIRLAKAIDYLEKSA
jgi:hypothetical protein